MIKSLSVPFIQRKLGILLVLLLVAVILILQTISLIEETNPNLIHADFPILGYLTYFYATLMFLVFSVLIRLEFKNLAEFNIDKFVVITFILASIIRRPIGIPAEGFFLIMIGLTGIFVVLTLVIKKPVIPKTKIRWVLFGLGISSIIVILFTFIELLFRNTWAVIPLSNNNILPTIISEILKEFSFGALIEEMLFRGFLWGYLRREAWNETKIVWTQGLLYWLLHVSKIVTPFTFFIFIPIITFIFSKLTLRSKQLYPSIIAHLVINVISTMLNLATY